MISWFNMFQLRRSYKPTDSLSAMNREGEGHLSNLPIEKVREVPNLPIEKVREVLIQQRLPVRYSSED